MAFSIGDVARITAVMDVNGEDVINTYHVRKSLGTAVSSSTALAAFAAKMDAAYAELVTQLDHDLHFIEINAHNITQDEPMGTIGWPTLIDGDVTDNDLLPTQTAALVLFNTEVTRSQGRKYIGGLIEGDNTDNAPDNDILGVLADYAAELLASWVSGAGTVTFGNYNIDLARFAPWISATVRDVWRTQRRRAKGYGS